MKEAATQRLNELAEAEHSRVSRQRWKPAIPQPGAHAGLNWPLASTTRREMSRSHIVIFESFFPEKGCTHKQAVCESGSVIRGVFVKEIFRYLWVLRASVLTSVCVCVCVCVCACVCVRAFVRV